MAVQKDRVSSSSSRWSSWWTSSWLQKMAVAEEGGEGESECECEYEVGRENS